MEVTISSLSDIQQEVEIQVTDQELQPHFDQAYAKYRPKVEIKGFRKGKVPLSLIKKMYGEVIEQEALDEVANDMYRQVMKDRDIRPIGTPSMVNMDFKRGEHFRFRIQYEIQPTIELGEYTGLAVERPVHEVTEEEVQAEVDHILRANSTTSEVQTVTDEHHIVIAEVQELDDTGAPLIGRKTSDAKFYLDDKTLAPEITDALKGAEVGQEYRVSFESHHEDHSHTVRIAIIVNKIEKVGLPEFDDAFVSKITREKVSTTAEFLTNVKNDLDRFWSEQSDKKVEEGIVSEIVRRHEFTVPESLINGLLDSYVEDVRNKSRDKKLPASFDEKKFREENRALAIWQAKWMLLKEKIVTREGITVSDADVEAVVEVEAGRTGIPKERLLEYYKKSNVASDRILSEKLMRLLKEKAIITPRVVQPDRLES